MTMKTMVGMVVSSEGRYTTVTCPDAPAHLRSLDLVPGQLRGAVVGDRVRLGYHVTSRSGLWSVIEVLTTVDTGH